MIFLNKLISEFELNNFFINIEYVDKTWFFFSNIISIILISFYIILLGIFFPNKAKIVKFLNLISAFYLVIFFYLTSGEFIYTLDNINIIFQQNYSLYVNLFIFIATITIFLFFLSISDIYYLEENMKIEYTLLVFYIYIGSILLISSLDFISIIILLECIAFSSYILVGFERKNKFSTSSALKYLILASIPSGFFILGVSILYNNYGSFYQDYLELLLIAFDNVNGATIDWSFINQYYNHNLDLNVSISFLSSFYEYIWRLNIYLLLYNPRVFLDYIDLEFLLIHSDYIKQELNYKEYFNFYYNADEALDLYIFHFDQLDVIFEHLTNWFLHMNWLFNWLNHSQKDFDLVFNDAFYFCKDLKILKGLYNWYSFLSYYSYELKLETFSNDSKEVSDEFFSFFELHKFHQANLNRLYDVSLYQDLYYYSNLDIINFLYDDLLKSFNNYYGFFIEVFFFPVANKFDFINNYSIEGLDISSKASTFNNICLITWDLFEKNSYNSFWLGSYFLSYFNLNEFDIYFYSNIFLSTFIVIVFILINLCFKITAAPFHFWAPSVYGGSPLPTVTFLSVFSKLTIIFFFINLFINVFENLKMVWQPILFFLGVLSVFISILGAFSEKLFKRFFVYSSIGHVGFIILGIAVLNYEGIQGAIDYLILYVISSFIIWFIVMHLSKKTTHLINFKGISYNYPVLSLILVISLFSISGLPPMGGFFVKFEIFYSLLNSSQYFLAYFLFILTVFSFFYYLRLIKIIYFEENKTLKKNKNLNDIKLRIISILIFLLPLYILFIQEPIFYLLKTCIIN